MKIIVGKDLEYMRYVKINSDDPYSHRCVTYAADWANLMEDEIAKGKTVAECAKETSHLADYDGITGNMYAMAVTGLAYFWAYGEELRRWHNNDVQIGSEGDEANKNGRVLNPAVIIFSEG